MFIITNLINTLPALYLIYIFFLFPMIPTQPFFPMEKILYKNIFHERKYTDYIDGYLIARSIFLYTYLFEYFKGIFL